MNKFNIKLLILIILLSFTINNINAQHKNDFEAGLYNIGFGGLIGGVGAVINKKPNEKSGKVFFKGFTQGALGGYLIFESKKLVGDFVKMGDYSKLWPSKIINSAGISILENASSNRNFWEKWHLNFGFNRLEIHTKSKLRVSYRIMPFALGSTIYGFTQGKFDFNESLKTGTFIFNTNQFINNVSDNGRTPANIILISNNRTYSKELILGHELIHTIQYESYSGFNSFLNKPINNLNLEKKWARIYHKIFYTDYNFLSKGLVDLATGNNKSNFFEREAQYYTE